MNILDDPRGQRSDERTTEAERRLSRDDVSEARKFFTEAAELETLQEIHHASLQLEAGEGIAHDDARRQLIEDFAP